MLTIHSRLRIWFARLSTAQILCYILLQKFIGGHGTTIGGVIIDSGKFDWTQSSKWPWLVEPNVSYHGVSFAKDCAPAAFATYIRAILLRDTGATISPVHAFIFLQGLETLSLRVERHVENALKVVKYLENQPQVEKVNPSIQFPKTRSSRHSTRSISRMVAVLSLHLRSRVVQKKHRNSSITLSCSHCLQT